MCLILELGGITNTPGRDPSKTKDYLHQVNMNLSETLLRKTQTNP